MEILNTDSWQKMGLEFDNIHIRNRMLRVLFILDLQDRVYTWQDYGI